MDQLTITAAAGLRSRMEALDLLSNNMANTSTPGFKADRESYDLYMSAEAAAAATSLSARSPLVEKQWLDLSQGSLRPTGEPTDLALNGPGFFLVEGPQGPMLTRGGPIRVSQDGKLITQHGYEFVTTGKDKIKANPMLPVQIDASGVVRQQGQHLGQLKLVKADDPAELARHEGSYFRMDLSKIGQLQTAHAEVRQGHLESSNLGPAEAAVRLVGILRQFESLQKAIQIGGDMNRRAVDEVAKVNP